MILLIHLYDIQKKLVNLILLNKADEGGEEEGGEEGEDDGKEAKFNKLITPGYISI
jgi:hypothetical protein